jgi:hypothetical protein
VERQPVEPQQVAQPQERRAQERQVPLELVQQGPQVPEPLVLARPVQEQPQPQPPQPQE